MDKMPLKSVSTDHNLAKTTAQADIYHSYIVGRKFVVVDGDIYSTRSSTPGLGSLTQLSARGPKAERMNKPTERTQKKRWEPQNPTWHNRMSAQGTKVCLPCVCCIVRTSPAKSLNLSAYCIQVGLRRTYAGREQAWACGCKCGRFTSRKWTGVRGQDLLIGYHQRWPQWTQRIGERWYEISQLRDFFPIPPWSHVEGQKVELLLLRSTWVHRHQS